MLLILIAMILIFTRDYITDDDLKRLIEGISLALFEVFYLYQAYKDLKDNQYITYKYIVLSDIVVILIFTFVCYLNFKNYENTDAIITGHSYLRWSLVWIGIVDLIKNYLRNEKFIKNKL